MGAFDQNDVIQEENVDPIHRSPDEVSLDVEAIQNIIGYKFQNPMLIVEAMTHHSYYYPQKSGLSYKRLEFIGDAALNWMISEKLFQIYKDLQPGHLTRLRAANVDTEKLARVAVRHGLHQHVRHKATALDLKTRAFIEAIKDFPIHSNGLVDAPKYLADVVESLIGAVYSDSNRSFETVWKVFGDFLEPFITLETLGRHPMSELQELCHKRGMELRFMKHSLKDETLVEVLIGDRVMGNAHYVNKEIAQNRAAKMALENLKDTLHLETEIPSPDQSEPINTT